MGSPILRNTLPTSLHTTTLYYYSNTNTYLSALPPFAIPSEQRHPYLLLYYSVYYIP